MLQIKKLLKMPQFTTQDAENIGISRRMLSYYVKKGLITRISTGIYKGIDDQNESDEFYDKWSSLASMARATNGVICLISALSYYELTDEFTDEFWIAISHNRSKPSLKNSRIFRMRNINLGVNEIELAKITVKIFDVERTIIDTFRLLDIETAMKALKIYMMGENGRPNIKKLTKYSKELRHDISKYLMPFVI